MTHKDLYRIVAETGLDPRTVSKVYAGKSVWHLTRERVEQAAKKLKLELPPQESKEIK